MRKVLVLWLLFALPPLVRADAIAIVIDVQGEALIITASQQARLEILASVQGKSKLRLSRGASVTVVHLGTKKEYRAEGPGTLAFHDNGVVTSEGLKVIETELGDHEKSIINIDLSRTRQGAVVFRASRTKRQVRLLYPVEEAIVEDVPTFRWETPTPGMRSEFTLLDAAGAQVLKRQADGTSFTLPELSRLNRGQEFSWAVESVGQGASTYSDYASFRVLSDQELASVRAHAPAKNALVSHKVLFALLLERLQLFGEARRYWAEVSASRPGQLEPAIRATQ